MAAIFLGGCKIKEREENFLFVHAENVYLAAV